MRKTINNILLNVFLLMGAVPLIVFGQSNVVEFDITEVVYKSIETDSWVEIINNGSDSVPINDLMLRGDDDSAITSFSNSPQTIPAGGIAIVAKDPIKFLIAFPSYDGLLYETTFTFGNSNSGLVRLVKDDETLSVFDYLRDTRIENTRLSFHIAIDGEDVLIAPATPGEIATNPIPSEDITTVNTDRNLSIGIRGGSLQGEGATRRAYLSMGDTISLVYTYRFGDIISLMFSILAKDSVESPQDSGEAFVNGDLVTTGTYTVDSNSPEGALKYTIFGTLNGSDFTSLEGPVTYGSQEVIVDKTPPILGVGVNVSGQASTKTYTITSTDVNKRSDINYKISETSCLTESEYDSSSAIEELLESSSSSGDISTFNFTTSLVSNNDKYLCVRSADLAGNISVASEQIQGIVPAIVRISEIHYKDDESEWIEIVNTGFGSIDPTSFSVFEGGKSKDITYVRGPELIQPNGYAVITDDVSVFSVAYPEFTGSLFSISGLSLTNSGETLRLREKLSQKDVHVVAYTSANGGNNGSESIHVGITDGILYGGVSTPGAGRPPEAENRAQTPQPDQIVTREHSGPSVELYQVSGVKVSSGKNLYFTNEDEITLSFKVKDNTTSYSADSFDQYITDDEVRGLRENFRYERTFSDTPDEVIVTYTVYFQRGQSGAEDNRIFVFPVVENEDGDKSSRRVGFVVSRNTTAPVLSMGTNAEQLEFKLRSGSSEKVVVPVSLASLNTGDWTRLSYVGSCSQGSTRYLVRAGGHGISYNLSEGSYDNCIINSVDSAGNQGNALSLPEFIVSH